MHWGFLCNVLSLGIEPRVPVPQTGVLSIKLREHVYASFILVSFQKFASFLLLTRNL